ncbi:glycoside hydrolase family 43 protein [Xylariaceae sp. FL1651]|nr:glycoside hydrolase family 43 protein [Xylariaceae sp. FL1651]
MALTGVLIWLLSVAGVVAMHQQHDTSTLTLTSIGTPDPFVTKARGRYYLTFTAGDRIEIWSSRSLVDIESSANRHVIWKPPHGTDHSADLWAPELHAVRGRWYIYYAAASPKLGNKSHRMYVLGGPPAKDDPCQGQWEFLGRIHDTPDQWAIDGTVFELNDQLYFAYSGWPGNHHDPASDLVQQLFLLRLDDPTTAGSLPVAISAPQQPWEITRDADGTAHAINEGPQWLAAPDGRWRGLVYSCAGSWTHEYKMAALTYRGGGSPLDPASWVKASTPLLCSSSSSSSSSSKRSAGVGAGGPFGPGHGSFLDVGGGNVVAVYHATDRPDDGWENRRARVQRVAFTDRGPGKLKGVASGLVERIKARLSRKRGGDLVDPAGEEDLRALLEGWKPGKGRTR